MRSNEANQSKGTKQSNGRASFHTTFVFCIARLFVIVAMNFFDVRSVESATADDGTYANVSKVESIESESNQPLFTKKNYPWHIQPKQPIWQAATSYAPHPLLFALLLMLLTLWVTVWDGLEKGSGEKSAPVLAE